MASSAGEKDLSRREDTPTIVKVVDDSPEPRDQDQLQQVKEQDEFQLTGARKLLQQASRQWDARFRLVAPGPHKIALLALLLGGVVLIVASPLYVTFRAHSATDIITQTKYDGVCMIGGKVYSGAATAVPAFELATNHLYDKPSPDNPTGVIAMAMHLTHLTASSNLIEVATEARYPLRWGNLTKQGVGKSISLQPILNLSHNEKLIIYTGNQRHEYVDVDHVGPIKDTLVMQDALNSAYASYTFYPFDMYSIYLPMTVVKEIIDPVTNNITSIPLDACFAYVNDLPGFEVNYAETSGELRPHRTSLYIHLQVQRKGAIKFFSIFIVVIMWCLALMYTALTLDHLVLRPRVPSGMATTGASLIFAVITVRNAQPDVPTIGTIMDMISFLWCLVLLGISSTCIYASAGGYYKYDPAKDKKEN